MKQYGKLKEIGRFYYENEKSYIQLNKVYSKGLKYLDLFSHVIVLFANPSNRLLEQVFPILHVEEKSGILVIQDNKDDNNNYIIFDIKPYFPCEDRVQESSCSHPLCVDNITELSIDESNSSYPYMIPMIGTIHKQDGKSYIEVKDTSFLAIAEQSTHIKIFWWFHRFEDNKYRTYVEGNPPYENAPKTGIFATRSPVRPNPIAMTTAKVLSSDRERGRIYINGIDCFNNSSCLGILPYRKEFDCMKECRVPEWLKHWPEWFDDNYYNLQEGPIQPVTTGMDLLLKEWRDKNQYTVDNSLWEQQEHVIEPKALTLTGGRQNNLKDISATIPYHKITVVTGVSGSGKSSLVYDTIHAECKRRFMDSMGGTDKYIKKPDMDSLLGAIPSIAISQKGIGKNIRSTVGTYSDIYDYIRTIFATVGVRHCPECKETVKPMSREYIIRRLELEDELRIITLDNEEVALESRKDSISTALERGQGAFWAVINGREPVMFQTKEMCYHCNRILFKLTPTSFNYNDLESMCPVCNGYGERTDIDPEAIIDNPEKSILDGASVLWGDLRSFIENPNANWMKGEVVALASEMNIDLEQPWKELPAEFKRMAIYGSGDHTVTFTYNNKKNGRTGTIVRPVEGAYNILKRLYKDGANDPGWQKLIKKKTCDNCNGERLSLEGRLVTIVDKRFPQIASLAISELIAWCIKIPYQLEEEEFLLIKHTVQKLYQTAIQADELGIGYLQLDRSVTSLSGGEQQRLKLLSQLSTNMSGILYVLDEPTKGLHPKDYDKLIRVIQRLKENGNTILMVEHNEDIIKIADHIIEIGPIAGEQGGFLIEEGSLIDLIENSKTRTARLLQETAPFLLPKEDVTTGEWAEINGAAFHNLKRIDIRFPVGGITCISGVSGSGKSSLLKGIIYPAMDKEHNGVKYFDSSIGSFDSVVLADQSPIGRTPRSVPATFMGIMDEIRMIYSQTKEAKKNKIKANSFSFNGKEGQCDHCKGGGQIMPEFTEDIWVTCPVCKGKRFKKHILNITYKDYTIADVLELSIEKARSLWEGNRKITDILDVLIDVGLSYLKLGQNSATLSGGEAQRIKLAKELAKKGTGNKLYLFDEPTMGLHYDDCHNLMSVFRKLTQTGSTIVMIEHNKDMIRNSDWLIELGPGAGKEGGEIVRMEIID